LKRIVPVVLACLLVLLAARPGEAKMGKELEPWIGRYAMELRVASIAKLPLLPSDRSTTVSLMLVDLQRGRDGTLTQRHRVCDVRMENSSSMRTTVPAAFLNALATRQYPVQLRSTGGKWRYDADMGLDAIGFDPRVSGGTVPEGPDSPGVIDADGDGNPGATIEVRVPLMGRARLFIAQRTHLVLQAQAATPDRVEGVVDIRLMEQRTLGADPGMFRRTPDIRPDPERSGFTLVRLPDGIGCADLRQRATALFSEDAVRRAGR
jgi:hypothetical protein